ncbi:MAG: cytochrome b, partial [Nocardioidaceae bacterium]
MRILNGDAGYGAVTKALHWLTVAALVVQFTLGYALEGLSERFVSDDSDADESLVFAHAWVGMAILCLAVTRLAWRAATPLPAWSERLTARDRRVAHRT